MNGKKVSGVIMKFVNGRGLRLERARALHECMFVLVLMYGSRL